MKKYILIFLIFIFHSSFGQFNLINNASSSTGNCIIKQIDNLQNSTVFHFQVTTSGIVCANQDFFIRDNSSYKKYNLLNTFNIPICEQNIYHSLGNTSSTFNFSLEFEKIPENLSVFDVIEEAETGWKWSDVTFDKVQVNSSKLDIESFSDATPLKEFGFKYKDGQPIYFYKTKSSSVQAIMTAKKEYGKYYQVAFKIVNLSNKDIHFNPNNIKAEIYAGGYRYDLKVLTSAEYMKKVSNRQAWAAAAVAYSESYNAQQAGYSSTSTSSYSSGTANTDMTISSSNFYDLYSDTEYDVNATTRYSGTTRSYSTTYNGQAAYAANQNAQRNINNYSNQLSSQRKALNDGYAKLNTIEHNTEYIGYVNIKYKKGDKLNVSIPFGNEKFDFSWE